MDRDSGDEPEDYYSEGSQPETGGESALFMDSTISKDGTVEDHSNRREMLSKFSREPEKGRYYLQNGKAFIITGPQDCNGSVLLRTLVLRLQPSPI